MRTLHPSCRPRPTSIAALALAVLVSLPAGARAGHASRTIVVTTAAELQAAMVPANAGARIVVRAGNYDVDQAMTVPDRATLVGDGVMLYDGSGLPTGFRSNGRTAIRATSVLFGDVLTLGDGATLKNLAVEDAAGRASGNPVAVVSREAGDSIAVRITECEIVNPNPSGIVPQGPTGRALVIVTRNPNLGQDPPPHEGSTLQVRMDRSILRSPAGAIGVFAINFASQSEIALELRGNVIGGGLSATAGVGRPDAVTGSAVSVQSQRNLYRSDGSDPTSNGWFLLGGADAPSPAFVSEASTSNSLRIRSRDDSIEGFATSILSAGGLRFGPLSAPVSSNSVDLGMRGARLSSTVSDLALYGALSFADVPAGDDNSLSARVRQTKGSGPRSNQYADSATSSGNDLGSGNELEFAGTPAGFLRFNEDIEPPPPAEFFEACQ